MQVIRLQRVGKKNQPSFRVVLQEKSWVPQGKAQELLGFYDPVNKERKFHKERINHWISKGAQPSPTVHNLLVDAGIVEGKKVQAWRPKVKPASPETDQGGEKSEEGATEEAAEKTPAEAAPQEGDEKAPEEDAPAKEKDEAPEEGEGKEEAEPSSAEDSASSSETSEGAADGQGNEGEGNDENEDPASGKDEAGETKE